MGIQFEIFARLAADSTSSFLCGLAMEKLTPSARQAKEACCFSASLCFRFFLIFALAETQLYTKLNHKSIVFTIDRSDSVKEEVKEAQWIREAVKARSSEKDESGVVSMALKLPLRSRWMPER